MPVFSISWHAALCFHTGPCSFPFCSLRLHPFLPQLHLCSFHLFCNEGTAPLWLLTFQGSVHFHLCSEVPCHPPEVSFHCQPLFFMGCHTFPSWLLSHEDNPVIVFCFPAFCSSEALVRLWCFLACSGLSMF